MLYEATAFKVSVKTLVSVFHSFVKKLFLYLVAL